MIWLGIAIGVVGVLVIFPLLFNVALFLGWLKGGWGGH